MVEHKPVYGAKKFGDRWFKSQDCQPGDRGSCSVGKFFFFSSAVFFFDTFYFVCSFD